MTFSELKRTIEEGLACVRWPYAVGIVATVFGVVQGQMLLCAYRHLSYDTLESPEFTRLANIIAHLSVLAALETDRDCKEFAGRAVAIAVYRTNIVMSQFVNRFVYKHDYHHDTDVTAFVARIASENSITLGDE